MRCAEQSFPWIGDGHLELPCTSALTSADELEVTLALLESAEAAFSYAMSALGYARQDEPLVDPMRAAVVKAIGHAAQLLAADPGPATPTAKPRRELPFLALSGGAANGAFTAGYLHALLSLREAALSAADVPTGKRNLIERSYRFGGATGTSVGSLVSTLADLYFTDPPSPLPAELDSALRTCLASSALPMRAIQACAMRKLRQYFVVNEWELLCAEDGTFLELFEDRQNALRFDPLRDHIIEPFFATFGSWVTGNDFLRIPMVADLDQNVTLGLDERACRLAGMDRGKCLAQAVLASISEPTFAPPVSPVYSGLRGPAGETGRWLDGGLRTGTPSARAVQLTADRVLAISTARSEGVPAQGPEAGFSVLLSSVDALVSQTRQWELAYSDLYRQARRDRGCKLGQTVGLPTYCPVLIPLSMPYVGLQGDLRAVFPPLDIAPVELFASGYTFDPFVMKGLFAWGQKSFLDSRQSTLAWLGWKELLALEEPAGGSAIYRTAVASYLAQVAAVIAEYSHVTSIQLAAHRLERRKLLGDHMTLCEE